MGYAAQNFTLSQNQMKLLKVAKCSFRYRYTHVHEKPCAVIIVVDTVHALIGSQTSAAIHLRMGT